MGEIKKICSICGKTFSAHQNRTKYCSKRCYEFDYRRNGAAHRQNQKTQKISDEQLLIAIKEGLTRQEIADKYSIHVTNIDKRMQRLGIYAKHKEQSSKKQQHAHTLAEYKKIRKDSAEIKQLEKVWYKAIHTVDRECVVCGKIFNCLDKEPKKTCSSACSKKWTYRKSDRRLNYKNIIDSDITLEKLYKRDHGICSLCGGKCDFNDYEIDEKGNRITHDNYPSIDHIKPLSRGGKHQWKNVQLAHFKCNYEKGDITDGMTHQMLIAEIRSKSIERANKNGQSKRTAQYTLDGKLIRIWDSTAQVERELGLNAKHIQNTCRKSTTKTGNAYGYHWEYITENVEHEDIKLKE